jgi:hypothetical protein
VSDETCEMCPSIAVWDDGVFAGLCGDCAENCEDADRRDAIYAAHKERES